MQYIHNEKLHYHGHSEACDMFFSTTQVKLNNQIITRESDDQQKWSL